MTSTDRIPILVVLGVAVIVAVVVRDLRRSRPVPHQIPRAAEGVGAGLALVAFGAGLPWIGAALAVAVLVLAIGVIARSGLR